MTSIEQDIEWRLTSRIAGSRSKFSLSNTDRKLLVLALIALFSVRLVAAIVFPFVDTTEARYAEIARLMLETGDWITPQFDEGVPFWGKPPLHTWMTAAGMAIFGESEFGGRFFILVSALGVLALIYGWVQAVLGRDEALIAVVVLSSSAMFFGASAFVMTDMVMTLGLVLSMATFHQAMSLGSRAGLWLHLFFVGLAIGLLAKGPVALVLAGLALIPWLAFSGRWRSLKHLPWGSSLLLLAVLTAPWYIVAEFKTPGFLNYFLIGEHFERFVVSGWEGDRYGTGHARPLGIVWIYWAAAFLPWAIFIFPVLWNWRVGPRPGTTAKVDWEGYLVSWALAPLLLFTPAANLLSAYVLPGLPATAILLVTFWSRYCGVPGWWTRVSMLASVSAVPILFMATSVLLLTSPQTLRLKTERALVTFAQRTDPEIHLTYWGNRSFSADFYTQGLAQYTIRTAEFDDLLRNTHRDAVALPQAELTELGPLLLKDFKFVGIFGRRALFIERTNREDGL